MTATLWLTQPIGPSNILRKRLKLTLEFTLRNWLSSHVKFRSVLCRFKPTRLSAFTRLPTPSHGKYFDKIRRYEKLLQKFQTVGYHIFTRMLSISFTRANAATVYTKLQWMNVVLFHHILLANCKMNWSSLPFPLLRSTWRVQRGWWHKMPKLYRAFPTSCWRRKF